MVDLSVSSPRSTDRARGRTRKFFSCNGRASSALTSSIQALIQVQALPSGLLDLLLVANPTDAYRLLNLSSGGASALSGMGGIVGHTRLSTPVLVGALGLWTVLPLAVANFIFARREV